MKIARWLWRFFAGGDGEEGERDGGESRPSREERHRNGSGN